MKTTMIMQFLMFLMVVSCNTAESEIIIVPKDYRGYVIIVFNQKNGEPPKFENGKRLYEIPLSGVLKTQFQGSYNFKNFPEYYFEKANPENKIASYVEFEKIPPNTVVGFMGESGKAYKDVEGKEAGEFALRYVGTKNEIEGFIKEAERLDIKSLVK